MGGTWGTIRLLCSPSCPVQSSWLCSLSWQTWLGPQVVLLRWWLGKAAGRAGRQVTCPSSIHVQQGQGSTRSCPILYREVMLEACSQSVGEGGGRLAWRE